MQSLQKQLLLLFSFGCLSAAIIDGSATLVPVGSQQHYELHNKVSIKQLSPLASNSEEASYKFVTQLKINSVWHSKDAQLLQVFLTDSQVSAPGKKSEIKRSVTKIPDRPFYISLIEGRPKKVIAHTSRDQSLLNLERGIASLLQLQFENGAVSEVDVSGRCNAFYKVKSSTHVEKTKTDCSHWDLRVNYRSELPLSIERHSQEQVTFQLSADGALQRVESRETQRLALAAKPDVGNEINSVLALKHVSIGLEEVEQLNFETLDAAVDSLLEWYRVFDIEADVDGAISELKGETIQQALKSHIEPLQSVNIGKARLALSFAQLLPLARIANEEELVNLLETNKALHPQLVDLLGTVQTIDAHNAINKVFKYDNLDDADLLEKYLQALAIGTHPERAIIEQLFSLLNDSENPVKNSKLFDTITQTVAALTYHSSFDVNDSLFQQIRSYLLENLQEHCTEKKTEETACKTLYIRALQNLRDPSTINDLLHQAKTATTKISVTALQALKVFPLVHFNETHRKIFSEIFYQTQRKYDSSARTIAVEILLALKPNPEQLGHLLDYLASSDRQFEIKTYVIQKLNTLATQCPRFRALLAKELSARPYINNYHIIAQKGLTTVLRRELSQTPAYNESLLSIQEVYQGILKRGTVELLLAAGRTETSTFKLGIYTNGLNSFVGDDEDSSAESNISPDDIAEDEDNTATAGMEIAVQGIHLRPLVFFNGQTELMGHVWGGTASDSTPAYQATTLAQNHEQYVMLSSGATIYSRILGARSIDLNGKVNFSLWNRNAQTEIQQNTGTAVVGYTAVGFTYAKLITEFNLTQEPNIVLQADLDFYSGVKLCMQLQRPTMELRYKNTNTVFLQSVLKPYTKRITSKFTHKSPGRTLALNQKNNEMCNLIISDN